MIITALTAKGLSAIKYSIYQPLTDFSTHNLLTE